MKNISHPRLLELLHYNPETGIFTWRQRVAHRVHIGDIAGSNGYQGYRYLRLDKRSYRAHRVAWFYMHRAWPEEVDHKDHIRCNNAISNLRPTNRVGNCKNASLYKTNKSGVPGVIKTNHNTWRVMIGHEGKKVYNKTHKDFFDAVCKRKSLEVFYGFHPNHGQA